MSATKVRVPQGNETYLATLYGKALDAAAARPILGDRLAAEAVARIDTDFAALKLPRGGEISLPLRALHFDRWTRAFLAEHPAATVLHLGCGLDARVHRVDPPPSVRWFEVDLPEVIALGEQLYPEREGVRRIGASVTDLAWLDAIPGDLPVLVVAEGLSMYLRPEEGTALLRRITEQFPRGQIAFDGYSAVMVRLLSRFARVRGAKVELRWGIDEPRDLERHVPRLCLVEDVAFLTMPELVSRLSQGWFSDAMYGAIGRLPLYRRLIRHLRYAFSREPPAAGAP